MSKFDFHVLSQDFLKVTGSKFFQLAISFLFWRRAKRAHHKLGESLAGRIMMKVLVQKWADEIIINFWMLCLGKD